MKYVINFKTNQENQKRFEFSLTTFDPLILPDYHEQIVLPDVKVSDGKTLLFLVGRKLFTFKREGENLVWEITVNGSFVEAEL